MTGKTLNKNKSKVAVLLGGFEPEAYASRLTGNNIYKALCNLGYKHVEKINVDKNVVSVLQKSRPDFAFLALFCKWGEDGIIQSVLEALNIPYSGSGVETSAICKNKFFFNNFARANGFLAPTVYFYGTESELKNFPIAKVLYPCIIKPVYQGYSLGVSLAKSGQELKMAAQKAFLFSTKIVIEEFIDGREFTIGVIDIPGKSSLALPIVEVRMKQHLIQNTEVKDDPSLAEEIIPALISKSESKKLKELALDLYKKLGCLGVSRFDVRQGKKGNFYFLENNTCPGILNYEQSDLPKQLKSMGISLEEFAQNMIKAGLNRPETKLEYLC